MFRLKGVWILVVMVFAAAASLQADTTYSAAKDYAGNNPNGVWTYGWSTTPGSGLTVYSKYGTDVGGYPQFDSWSDPTNFISFTPVVYLNTGGEVNDSELHNVPGGALVLHGGGTAASCGTPGACFSEVVWTAPGTGWVDLSATFTGRQYNINGLVEIVYPIAGGTATFSGSVDDQTSQSFNQLISVQTGDTITFAAKSNTGLNWDTTQLDATLRYGVPEPSTCALLLVQLGCLGYCLRRRREV